MSNSANLEAKAFSMECIETALLALLKEKPYGEISYSELAKRAGVSRNAIYRNYRTQDDILEKFFQKKTEAFLKTVSASEAYADYLLKLFEHLYALRDESRLMLNAGKENIVYRAFLYMRNRYEGVDDSIIEYYDYYRIGGIYSVYIHWIESGLKESPLELRDKVLRVMSIHGIVPKQDFRVFSQCYE